MPELKSTSGDIPGRIARIKKWAKMKRKMWPELGHVRLVSLPMLSSYYRLSLFRKIISFFEKMPFPKISYLFFIVSISIILTYSVLYCAYPYEKEGGALLRSLLVNGLLIAPLIGLLNNGFTYIISVYLKVFDKNEHDEKHLLEPRHRKIREDVVFIRQLVKFENESTIKLYVEYVRDSIISSLSYRSDIDYRSSFATILIGIAILIGFILILLNLLKYALFVLMLIYVSLILKSISVFRTTIKLWLLENLLSRIVTYIEKETPSGEEMLIRMGSSDPLSSS